MDEHHGENSAAEDLGGGIRWRSRLGSNSALAVDILRDSVSFACLELDCQSLVNQWP